MDREPGVTRFVRGPWDDLLAHRAIGVLAVLAIALVVDAHRLAVDDEAHRAVRNADGSACVEFLDQGHDGLLLGRPQDGLFVPRRPVEIPWEMRERALDG